VQLAQLLHVRIEPLAGCALSVHLRLELCELLLLLRGRTMAQTSAQCSAHSAQRAGGALQLTPLFVSRCERAADTSMHT
jgi:hypothetical protein